MQFQQSSAPQYSTRLHCAVKKGISHYCGNKLLRDNICYMNSTQRTGVCECVTFSKNKSLNNTIHEDVNVVKNEAFSKTSASEKYYHEKHVIQPPD